MGEGCSTGGCGTRGTSRGGGGLRDTVGGAGVGRVTGSGGVTTWGGAGSLGVTMTTFIGPGGASGGISGGFIGIAKNSACAASDTTTATSMRRTRMMMSKLGSGSYLPRSTITLPATEMAMPTQVRGCHLKPSNAAETMSATIGTITPMYPERAAPMRSSSVR